MCVYLNLCLYFACMKVLREIRRGCQVSWNWGCSLMWVLGTMPGSSVRAAIVINCWAVSPAFCPVLAQMGGQTKFLTFWSWMSVSYCQVYPMGFISFHSSPLPFKLFSLTPLPSEFSWRQICSQMTMHKVQGPVLNFEHFFFPSHRSNSITIKRCIILVCLSIG